jgi:glycosyltransferase involved in cell wall biosynthesis
MTVSIIVPCYNEAAHIERFISNIVACEKPESFEVIVVDGMSTDGTREKIMELVGKYKWLFLMTNDKHYTSISLNIGIRGSRGDVIIRMDVHTEYHPKYIMECLRNIQNKKGANVGGPWLPLLDPDNYIQYSIALAFSSPFAIGPAKGHDAQYEGIVDTVYLGCWEKSTLLKVGLFDESLIRNQDDELCFRIKEAGLVNYQDPKIISWYCPRASIPKLFRQYFQYGYWKMRVIKKHGRPASFRHLVPSLALLLGACLAIGSFFSLGSFYALLFLASVYIVLDIFFALKIAFGCQRKTVCFILPLVLSVFHFSYGLGFILSLVSPKYRNPAVSRISR